jgi:hypothetical protein
MKNEARGYFLKEYGSWSVLIIAYLIGLGVSRAHSMAELPLFFALGLLINSKQAFMKWVRRPGNRTSLAVFIVQIVAAAVVIAAVFLGNILMLLPLLVIPACYLILSKLKGEHFVLTEVLGFMLISLAAVLAKFLLTESLDVRLFLGVALYFSAGVFKIKALILKRTKERAQTAIAVVLAIVVYHFMNIPIIILLPLADNLIVAAVPYRVKLRTTGWIEVTKGLLFLCLFINFY